MIQGLQERAARASPATTVEIAEGWWLRHAPGCAWWVGTVLPHGPSGPAGPARQVARAEAFYAARRAATCFQITPEICAQELDPWLAASGYVKRSPISLRTASTAEVIDRLGAASLDVQVDERPTPAWFETWYSVHGQGRDRRSERELLARVGLSSGYARAAMGEKVVGVGRVVADGGWAGIFGMATLLAARGNGAARSVLAALARWAEAVDVDRLYLQVECDNVPALRLYSNAGFTEVCEYHYRAP